jgi:hypothetical protein
MVVENLRPLSSEIRDGLAACENLRGISGPMGSDRVEHELEHIETLLRHLLHLLTEKSHVSDPTY